jgi:cytochrome c oxidase subunit 2
MSAMRIDLYERIWMWAGGVMIAAFLLVMTFSSVAHAVHPPSHVETIDPAKVATDPDFSRPRVETRADGSMLVVGTAEMYAFHPDSIRVTRGRPVTFRLTSTDVVHGFEVVGTNANAMLLPGYVTQFTVTFPRAGDYLIVCNEYCGLAHHLMQASLRVEDATERRAPAP